jgi:AraC-like DNA-binding protein
MYQTGKAGLDPVSQGYGRLVDLTTDGVPAAERLEFWRSSVLKRTRPEAPEEERPFRARLRRIVLDDAELVEHASDAVVSSRAPGRTRMEGGDDIALELMRDCRHALLDHNGEHRLRPGDLYLVDYARPMNVIRSRHRAGGIVLSRRRVREVLGDDLSALAGHRIPARGMAAVLRQHMRSTIDEAAHLSIAERTIATKAAADMALAILQAGRFGAADPEQFGDGFYRAARRLIDRHCTDPDLTPERIATALGCSRASLYRAFARHDRSVAAEIWSARIERARRMLGSSEGVGMLIADIAFHCGFREIPTFTRMFRRRYGMSPREARDLGSPG